MKTILALSTAFVLALSGAASAGPAKSPAGQEGSKAKVTRTVKIEMTEYAFSQTTMDFKAGETVKFIVINNGKLKHELTVGTAEEQKAHRAAMQSMSDMNHDEHSHEMPANAIHVNPGETRELVWHFTKAGSLQFACNYPGHADLGMEGSIAVR